MLPLSLHMTPGVKGFGDEPFTPGVICYSTGIKKERDAYNYGYFYQSGTIVV